MAEATDPARDRGDVGDSAGAGVEGAPAPDAGVGAYCPRCGEGIARFRFGAVVFGKPKVLPPICGRCGWSAPTASRAIQMRPPVYTCGRCQRPARMAGARDCPCLRHDFYVPGGSGEPESDPLGAMACNVLADLTETRPGGPPDEVPRLRGDDGED